MRHVMLSCPLSTDTPCALSVSGWQQSTMNAAVARFRPKTQTQTHTLSHAHQGGSQRSVSGGSNGVSEASTKVAGWDGGRKSPSRLLLPSGVLAGRGVPPQGIFLPDTTGLTEDLNSPPKALYAQRASLPQHEPAPAAHRVEQIQSLYAYLESLRTDMANLRQEHTRSSTQAADAVHSLGALQTELADLKAQQATAAAALPARGQAVTPTAGPGPPHPALCTPRHAAHPASPSPPRGTAAPLASVMDDILHRVDTSQAQATRLLGEHMRSPARVPPGSHHRPSGHAPSQGFAPGSGPGSGFGSGSGSGSPVMATSHGKAHVGVSPAVSSRTAPAVSERTGAAVDPSRAMAEHLRQADLVAEIALLRRDVHEIAQQVAVMRGQVTDVQTQVSDVRTQIREHAVSPAAMPVPVPDTRRTDMSSPPLAQPALSPHLRTAPGPRVSSGSEVEAESPPSDQNGERLNEARQPSSSSGRAVVSHPSSLHASSTRFRRSPLRSSSQTAAAWSSDAPPVLSPHPGSATQIGSSPRRQAEAQYDHPSPRHLALGYAPSSPQRASAGLQENQRASDRFHGDDLSGTALSEMELSHSLDASRLEYPPPQPSHGNHAVDHSHDPKKCVPCTRARRAERKRKARMAQAEAEARRIEQEAAATDALVGQIDHLLVDQGTEATQEFVASLAPESLSRLHTLHSQLVDDFYHQRNVYAGLADELKLLDPHKVRYTITATHVSEAITSLEGIAARIEMIHTILPSAPVEPVGP